MSCQIVCLHQFMLIENRANIYQFDEYGGNFDFSIHVLTDELESEERLLQRFDTCLNIYKKIWRGSLHFY